MSEPRRADRAAKPDDDAAPRIGEELVPGSTPRAKPVRPAVDPDDAVPPRGAAANAGYTGGLAEGAEDAVGMRQVVVGEATEARREGEDVEPPSNLGQQDQ